MANSEDLGTIADSVAKLLSEICNSDYQWDCPRRFSGYVKRLELCLNQFLKSTPDPAPSAQTALRGIAADAADANRTLATYRNKSKIFVLINCQTLCENLRRISGSIAGWLALLDSSLDDAESAELRKKIKDLSSEMHLPNFKVTENEERVYWTLQKEAQGRQSTKAVQSAIIMDLARTLGIESENHAELARQIDFLKKDMTGSVTPTDRRISVCLGRIFESWTVEPKPASTNSDPDFEEDASIPPFKNFICPLTKEVMKDPVVLESSQTYERTAIQYWFDRCADDGRDATCPVTGQVLKTLEQKPNLSLAGTIDEWVGRNIDMQIESAVQLLASDSCSAEAMNNALKNIYRISEVHPSRRYKVRNAGLIPLLSKALTSSSPDSQARIRALKTLLSIAKDEESKHIMIKEGVTRLAIHSLIGNLEKEGELALKLLLEFSGDENYSTKLALEKGALLLLTSIAGDAANPSLANLAETILKNMDKVESNVELLAAAGRFQPLLMRLSEGNIEVKLEMASMVGKMALANNGKEHIARHGAKALVKMLSSKEEASFASLQALNNLSSLDDNAVILVDSGILLALTNIIFKKKLEDNSPVADMKELAASTLGNIVSKSGHWELTAADWEGNLLQSDHIIHKLLELLAHSGPRNQLSYLRILSGIASSPRAADVAATHISSGNGIMIIVPFLAHPEVEHRIYAFRLVNVLSERAEPALLNELRNTNKLALLNDKLLADDTTDDERALSACILANLKLSDDEVKSVLRATMIRWIVLKLKEQRTSSVGRSFRASTSLVEGLLGLLTHFIRSSDPEILNAVKENRLITVFKELLRFSPHSRIKQRAAIGLRYLSEAAGRALHSSVFAEPRHSKGFTFPFIFACCRPPPGPALCPVHNAECDEDSNFCLLRTNSIRPLVELMSDESSRVQRASVEALSTLLADPHNLKQTTTELDQLGMVSALMTLFSSLRPSVLQEKVIWMVEKILKVDSLAQAYSTDQGLVKALIDAFKYGSAETKLLAQESLTNLKQLSGVGGRNSYQPRGR